MLIAAYTCLGLSVAFAVALAFFRTAGAADDRDSQSLPRFWHDGDAIVTDQFLTKDQIDELRELWAAKQGDRRTAEIIRFHSPTDS